MSGGVYGGDEVGAIVVDPGSYTVRIGYAGEDSPKFDIPSTVGRTLDPDTQETKFSIDTVNLTAPRKGCEVSNIMKDGMIEDWDAFENLMDYAYKKCIKSDSQYHPMLCSEAAWNARGKREKICELFFEKYQVPAFFLVKSAVLSAFANGRFNCVVVDSGASHTSAVPVIDGYVLQHAIIKSPLGGDFLTNQVRHFLTKQLSYLITDQSLNYLKEHNIDLAAPYLIAEKKVVREGDPPKWTRRSGLPEVTQSWHSYQERQVVRDFTQAILTCSESAFEIDVATSIPTESYEFPTGYTGEFGSERFRLAESLFDPSFIKGCTSTMLGMSHVVASSISLCDIDLRPSLYSGVVVTGGNSLTNGFVERLNRDLSSRTPPNMRLKMLSAQGVAERRFGSWIGGSILGSLGSFQQMWISRQEYDEAGKSQVDRKCP
ncbi:Actin family [Trinorchestia longiramus]|nr:Actin family [Trinorchestia longiramus]